MSLWFVRAGREGAYSDEFKNKEIIAVGWRKLGEITPEEAVWGVSEERIRITDPTMVGVQQAAKQIFKFVSEFKIGDKVITYNPKSRIYLVGEIIGDYEWNPTLCERYPRVRKVKWIGEVCRDDLSESTQKALNCRTTISELSEEAQDDIFSKL